MNKKLKPIPGFPNYFASENGEIYSMKPSGDSRANRPEKPRLLKKALSSNRYYHVILRKDGKSISKNIAELVLSAFVSSRPLGYFACHGTDGMRVDSLSNVYWASPRQNNLMDRLRDKTECRGAKHWNAKLNNMQVRVIRRAYSWRSKSGLSGAQLANIFNVSTPTISDIVTHKRWL